jgi:hypothetical protein
MSMILLEDFPYGLGVATLMLVFTLILVIGLFLIFRNMVCWYYKINDRIELQKKTNRLLEELIELERVKASKSSGLQQ